MARQLFGTDGIRGVAGEFPLDPSTTCAVGAALGHWISSHHLNPEVVIGIDTRESGKSIASSVAAGLARSGVKARFAGVITTPGVAYLARSDHFAAGVMISASHNPYSDNGIKVIDHSGFKLPDEQEHTLEGEIFALLRQNIPASALELKVEDDLAKDYIDYLASTFPGSLANVDLVLDCANGAASLLAPELFQRLGARVHATACSPDGRNINLNCGSLHLEYLRKEVLARGAQIGIAFDGDADRALFVSHSGRVVDGDAVMLLTSLALKEQGRLGEADGEPVVVATVMSNLGLERALAAHGITLVRTPVGDKYVLEEMVRRGAKLGGEQSGHIIFRDWATTGDGLLTALRVLEVIRNSGRDLDALSEELKIYPQRLVNVRVKEKRPLADLAHMNAAIRVAEADFGTAGRVLVRFSGTEPLARVMVEGPDDASVEHHANRIADAIRKDLT